MRLLRFFKPLDTLPTTEQTRLSVHTVSSANSAVQRVLHEQNVDRTRAHKRNDNIHSGGPCKVGEYAAQNGVARAQNHFQQLNLKESTFHCFKKTCIAQVSERARTGNSREVTRLEVAKCGRKVVLRDVLDSDIQ